MRIANVAIMAITPGIPIASICGSPQGLTLGDMNQTIMEEAQFNLAKTSPKVGGNDPRRRG